MKRQGYLLADASRISSESGSTYAVTITTNHLIEPIEQFMRSPATQLTSHVGLHVIPSTSIVPYKTLLIDSFQSGKISCRNHSWLLSYDAHFEMKSDNEVCFTASFYDL